MMAEEAVVKFALETTADTYGVAQSLVRIEGGHVKLVAQWQVDLGERKIRDALIGMGWVPPDATRSDDEVQRLKGRVRVLEQASMRLKDVGQAVRDIVTIQLGEKIEEAWGEEG